jgi:hypothetical protein
MYSVIAVIIHRWMPGNNPTIFVGLFVAPREWAAGSVDFRYPPRKPPPVPWIRRWSILVESCVWVVCSWTCDCPRRERLRHDIPFRPRRLKIPMYEWQIEDRPRDPLANDKYLVQEAPGKAREENRALAHFDVCFFRPSPNMSEATRNMDKFRERIMNIKGAT